MSTETILNTEQVDALLEGVLRASGSRLGNYTYQKTLDELRSSIRAIEQAVLQSDQVQAWKRDAERYRWLRNIADPSDWDYIGQQSPDVIDTEVDEAIRALIKKENKHDNQE